MLTFGVGAEPEAMLAAVAPILSPAQAVPADPSAFRLASFDPAAAAPPVAPADTPTDGRVNVQVIGNGFEVDGSLVTGAFGRLSDWLNMQQGWIHVEEGWLVRRGEQAADRPKSSQWIRLDQVLLVSERQPAQRDRSGASVPFVRKERRRVTIVTHGYTLRGYMHVLETGSMQTFLDSADPHFLPMTDVVVRRLLDETVVGHHPFALVNRAQLISVSEEVPHDEAESAVDVVDGVDAVSEEFLRTA